MRTFYLSLAVLALAFDASDAIGSSGLLRERKEEEHRQLQAKSGTKGSKGKGKGKSSSALSPVCPGEEVSKSKGGKGGKGGKGKSKSDTRFLEEVSRQLSKGKGKGKSSGGGECDCDYPTDLCEDETPTQVVCGQTITEDTVLSTSLGCELSMNNPPTPPAVNAGIIVDGVTLECTGDGDNMIYNTAGTSMDPACVVLRNGATLKNCHLYNCPIGVVMEGTGNNRIVGSTIFGSASAIETGSAPMSPHDRTGVDLPNMGCYSVECSKIVGGTASGNAAVYVRHDGTFILSNTDILGPQNTPLYIHPEVGNTLDVAVEDANIFGSIQGGTARSAAIQIGNPGAGPGSWGTVGEVGFYGTTKMVAHRYGILQDSTGSQNTSPPTVMVYGGIESYDTWVDSYQFQDAAVMFEDDSSALACTFAQAVTSAPPRDQPPDGVSFDIKNTAAFMDMGADFTCAASAAAPAITIPTACTGMGSGTCPAAPSLALTCAGSSGSGKSKGGKGGKGGKGKSKSETP